MKYRRLAIDGDYTFGSQNQDFVYDLEGVAQAIKTRLQLYRDSFWRDLADGLPMFQSILGSPGSQANLAVVDNIIKDRIANTTGVQTIVDYSSSYNRDAREYIFSATVQTIYSTTILIQQSF